MANTNCLAGLRCPNCGSYGDFWIEATITARVLMSDDGTVETDQENTLWEDGGAMECVECGHAAMVFDFRDEEVRYV